MPYIQQSQRAQVEPTSPRQAQSAGELNYQITRLCQQYVELQQAGHALTYTTLNAVVGVLECAKLEFYRRLATPYEGHKALTNGDVYR